jgi:phosphoribosylamine-glycine ligase
MTSLFTKIKSLDTQISSNTQNISIKQDALTAGNNITIDENNIILQVGVVVLLRNI